MQGEDTWMSNQSADESAAKERYEYFTRPEPRENMSDIFEIDDPYLGPKTKVREVRIGMTRNAADENRKVVTAYLEPFPHIRIADAKQLQGWYQSKTNESKQSRPRPCFTEAVLTEPYGGYCAVGCQFSLPGEEVVHTPLGQVQIREIKVGDIVYGRSVEGKEETNVIGWTKHWKPEGLVEVYLSDGRRLRMTGDHPVYSVDRRTWVRAENLQSGDRLEDETMCRLQQSDSVGKMVSTLLVGVQSSTTQISSGLSGLQGADSPAPSNRLQRLLSQDQIGKRTRLSGEAIGDKGATQVSRNAGADVCLRACSQIGDGPPRVWSEVGFMASGPGRKSASGGLWLQTVEETSVYGSKRANVSDEVHLGNLSGGVFGSTESRLGLRTVCGLTTIRSSVPTGLCPERRNDYRGQRVLSSAAAETNYGSPTYGIRSRTMGSTEAEVSRNPYVVGVKRLPGAVEVYDIETETGNFYHQGILVHNCYINSGMRGYRGTGLISVPINYGEQIKDQLTKMRRGAAVYFSSFTDPFTPLENHYHNTQTAAQACADVGLPLFFLSRLRYPEWAIDLLTKNPHSYAQKSINTCDPEDWRRLSPGAMALTDHLKEITELKKRGIYISIQCNPIVPGITSNEQVVKLFRMLRDAGADHVIVKFVEAAYSWAPALVERIKRVFGKDRGEAFERLFTQNIGAERTIEEDYRLRAHKLFSRQAKQLGLTYATCYEYRYEKDANGKILSKTGISIGRELTTAAQCHGHTVPVYTRNSAEEMFKPVEECPPSGCLYCADENEGEPRCGDELAGQANAVRWSDLKQPIGQGKKRALELPLV